jgi:hypothetical protein
MDIPPENHARWTELLSGGKTCMYRNLGVQMAVFRQRQLVARDQTPATMQRAVHELRTLFVEQGHLPSVHDDLVAMFAESP